MKFRPFIVLLVLISFASLNSPVFGWNARGHMMVAGAAYQHLTRRTKDRVDKLLALNPDLPNWLKLIPDGTSDADKKMMIFMIAATWADRIKGNHDYHSDGSHGGNRPPEDASANNNLGYTDFAMHKYWHFIDIPFSSDGSPLPGVPKPNAETRIDDFRKVLRSNKPDALKSYDLTWLLHLIGDIHQPLHGTTRVTAAKPDGDDGGNGVTLSGPIHNLHSYWDDLLGIGDSPLEAQQALAALPKAAATSSDLKTANWVKESFSAAKSVVYMNPPIGPGNGPFTLTPGYEAKAHEVAAARVSLAGARLAKILNKELK